MDAFKIILQIVSVIAGVYIAFTHKKKNILLVMFCFNAFQMLLVTVIRDYSAIYSVSLIITRSFIYLFQDKLKKHKWSHLIPFAICAAHIALGAMMIEHWYQVLTIIAPVIMSLSLWYENRIQHIRLQCLASEALWLAYNFNVGFYILCISRLILITSYMISICKTRSREIHSQAVEQ